MSPISSHVNNREVLRKPYQMSVSDQAPEASAPHSPLKFWNIIPSLSWGCKILDGALSLNLSMTLQVFCSSSLHIRFKHTCPEMNAIEWLGSSFRNDVQHKRSTPQVPVWLPWLVSRRTRRRIWVFPKIVVPPKSSILIGFSIINHPFWGTSIFGNTHME